MRDLVILGAGGFAREASFMVEELNQASPPPGAEWNLLGFIDEDEGKWGLALRGYPVLGGWDALSDLPAQVRVICVVGDPAGKKHMVGQAKALGRAFCSLVHPEVSLAPEVHLGEGVFINKACVITTDITIGNHVSINPGCGIGHDTLIGDYATLMWHVNTADAVEIGAGCILGTKATLLPHVRVGPGTTIGAGAVVTRDIPAGCTAVGIPARVVKEP